MSRLSEYTEDIADKICNAIAGGKSLNSICNTEEFPDDSTVYRWLDKHVEFRDKYARARDRQADLYAGQIVAISDEQHEVITEDGRKFDPEVNRDRLRIDARKWFASKVAPKKYGDKLDVDHGGNISVTVSQSDAGL